MKEFKTVIIIIYYSILRLILSPLWAIIWILGAIEKIFKIVKETLTFFIKQIESEVLK